MRRLISFTLLAFSILVLSPQYASAQISTELLDQHFSQDGFSGSVIITKNGSTIWANAYGMANAEHGVKNTLETKFRIGSVTKQFTSMAILILQERGLLKVEDTVGKHLVDVPNAWREITIHQLLTHTSGIMHSWALKDFASTMAVARTLDETLARYHGQPLLFEAGSQFQYSGVGYNLLAKIIECVSGTDYEAFLQREIFTPLVMLSTGSDTPERILKDRATGYFREAGGAGVNAPPIHMPILTGGGNLYSTVKDMALWGNALSMKLLVSHDSYEALYRSELDNYAYGWRVKTHKSFNVIYHSGHVPGFVAYVAQIPEQRMFVAILSNQTGLPSDTTINQAIKIILKGLSQ